MGAKRALLHNPDDYDYMFDIYRSKYSSTRFTVRYCSACGKFISSVSQFFVDNMNREFILLTFVCAHMNEIMLYNPFIDLFCDEQMSGDSD